MAHVLLDQLAAAFERSEWSVQTLLDKSGLDIDRSSLARKLRGLQPMTIAEAERIADVLGVPLARPPVSDAKAS